MDEISQQGTSRLALRTGRLSQSLGSLSALGIETPTSSNNDALISATHGLPPALAFIGSTNEPYGSPLGYSRSGRGGAPLSTSNDPWRSVLTTPSAGLAPSPLLPVVNVASSEGLRSLDTPSHLQQRQQVSQPHRGTMITQSGAQGPGVHTEGANHEETEQEEESTDNASSGFQRFHNAVNKVIERFTRLEHHRPNSRARSPPGGVQNSHQRPHQSHCVDLAYKKLGAWIERCLTLEDTEDLAEEASNVISKYRDSGGTRSTQRRRQLSYTQTKTAFAKAGFSVSEQSVRRQQQLEDERESLSVALSLQDSLLVLLGKHATSLREHINWVQTEIHRWIFLDPVKATQGAVEVGTEQFRFHGKTFRTQLKQVSSGVPAHRVTEYANRIGRSFSAVLARRQHEHDRLRLQVFFGAWKKHFQAGRDSHRIGNPLERQLRSAESELRQTRQELHDSFRQLSEAEKRITSLIAAKNSLEEEVRQIQTTAAKDVKFRTASRELVEAKLESHELRQTLQGCMEMALYPPPPTVVGPKQTKAVIVEKWLNHFNNGALVDFSNIESVVASYANALFYRAPSKVTASHLASIVKPENRDIRVTQLIRCCEAQFSVTISELQMRSKEAATHFSIVSRLFIAIQRSDRNNPTDAAHLALLLRGQVDYALSLERLLLCEFGV